MKGLTGFLIQKESTEKMFKQQNERIDYLAARLEALITAHNASTVVGDVDVVGDPYDPDDFVEPGDKTITK